MTGVKTNERPGTRARASYVRSSAYKAREVLNLVRGKSCAEAQEILAFSERDVAGPIGKALESALANAEHNDGLDVDELYVSACYADEGPTLKRWRPRARGRATRIRKRTCHITVIVSRYDAETLDELRSRQSRAAVPPADARRRRVARSRTGGDTSETAADSAPEAAPEPAAQDVEATAAAVVQATEAALASDSGDSGADRVDEPDDSGKSGGGS